MYLIIPFLIGASLAIAVEMAQRGIDLTLFEMGRNKQAWGVYCPWCGMLI